MNFMYFLAILIGPLVKILYSFIGNYAVTMVVATLLLKLLLFPLSIHQQKSSAKMAVFQPLMNEIQQKYKNDPQKQQEELMKLQQEHGFNPMGGCLPMLLTMLVLFGFLGVVYYPVHYIFGVDNAAVKAACEAIGIATANTSTMQTALIQAIHNGAVIDPSIIPANIVAEIQNFNTSFFGMDMCDVPGFRLVPIAIFPAIAAVTMFISYFVTQKLSGMDAQMQGSMKVMMLVMNLMFVTFCFNAPVGFSLYYGVSNLLQIGQSYITYKIYSPEKFKAQYEAELAAKLGVGLAFENMFDGDQRRFGSTAEDLIAIQDSFHSDLIGVCWDVGHANRMYRDQLKPIRKLGSRIKALHIDDNYGTARDVHLLPYEGLIDWSKVLRALREIGYDHDFAFEHALNPTPHAVMPAQLRYMCALGREMLSNM